MLLLPVFSLLLNGIGGQCTGAKCDSDTAELLQLQKRKKVALALSGGGFKAQATFAGFIPALLNAKDSTTKDLLSEVDAITCASSGCWYTSQLIYSQLFLNMTETMAQSPNAAGDVFAKRWIRPFLAAFEAGWSVPILQSSDEHRKRPTWTSAEEKVTGAGEDLLEILLETYWLTSGKMSKTWTEFVNIVLAGSMPDMNGTMKLNSPVNDWAKGKLWAVGTSVSMPGGSGPGTCHATDFDKSGIFCAVSPEKARSTVYDNGTDATLAYFSRESSGQSLASWMPACFSVQLGVSAAKSALPFCPSCLGATQHYENNGGEMEEVLKSLDFDANTPVLPAVTAASAFLGELMVLPIYDAKTLKWLTDLVGAAIGFLPFVHQDFVQWIEDDLFKALLTQWAVWSFTADTTNSFAEGTMARQEAIASNALLPRNSFETLASKGMMGIVDAGLSDNTAIGHALSAGKKEIIYVSCAGLNDLWRLFQGMKKDRQFFKIPGFNFCPFCYANVPAFQEQMKHSKELLEEELRAFTLDHPEMLTELKVGTMKLTTVKSEFWGIEADREVTLRLIIFDSSAQLGGFAYQDYPKLVQDIMDTFRSPANSELANLVLSWFEAP